jgi:hypothetical protein
MPSEEECQHEKFTAEKIASLCRETTRFARFGDVEKREPDIVFTDNVLGIEVTLAYFQGDEDDPNLHPREVWRHVRNPNRPLIHRIIDQRTGRPRVWDRMVERLQDRCQEAIDRKCLKTYEGVERTWLGIYVHAPPTEPHELDVVAKRLVIPSVNRFERIVLLHRFNSQYRALEIFPSIRSYV